MNIGHFVSPSVRSFAWHLASRATFLSVGLTSKAFLSLGVYSQLYGMDRLLQLLHDPQRKQPIITVANHASTLDDPLLWGFLPARTLAQPRSIRWSLGAKEVCHKNKILDRFFEVGKTLPIVRGDGIYQPAMNFALDRLNNNEWVHIFPEARVNQLSEMIRFKWGVARLIMECKTLPIVLPLWHQGMANIMPLNSKIPLPRLGKRLVLAIGDPIQLDDLYVASRPLVTRQYNSMPNMANKTGSIYNIYSDEPKAVVDMRIRIIDRLYSALASLQQQYKIY
ncbi:acyltransferase-domain-containing protein [Syncephalis fuscata]|nr:acyltransferase-domain-containing protein [Syncephalis fuscata]